MPALTMEMAFTQPFAASPTWTDVSAYVMLDMGITWHRGRADPLSLCQPGTSSWTFDNSDGRFVPNRSASPYYPNVKINRGVRFTAVWLGVTYRMFTQFTDPWQTDLEGGLKPISPMTATDRFKMFARKKLSRMYVEEVSIDGPSALYMMGEAGDVAQPVSQSSLDTLSPPGFNQAIYPREFGSLFDYGQAGPFADGSTSLRLRADVGTQLGTAIPYIPAFTALPFTVEFWAKLPAEDDDGSVNAGYLWSMQGPTSGIRGMYLYCNFGDGHLSLGMAMPNQPLGRYFNPDATVWESGQSSKVYRDGHWHHYAITVEDLGAQFYEAKLYIDRNLNQTIGTPGPSSSSPFYSTTSGLFQSFGMNMAVMSELVFPGMAVGRSPIYMYIAGIAFYAGVKLDPARITVHYYMGKYGYSGDKSGARLKRFLDYSMAPVIARTYTHSFPESLDTGISVMNMQNTDDTVAMDAISTAVQAEQGMLWVKGDGTVRFKDRDSFWNPTLDFTLTANQVGVDFSILMDDTLLINTCTATRKLGAPYIARNYTSQDEYGVYDDSVPDIPVSDDLLVDFARYRVSKYAVPAPRTYTITVTPSVTTALYPAMLACEPGQRFTITSLPSPLPSSLDLVVQSVEHNVTPDRWQTKITGAPTDMAKYAVWGNAATTWGGTAVWGW
jgi:hypothetical protein